LVGFYKDVAPTALGKRIATRPGEGGGVNGFGKGGACWGRWFFSHELNTDETRIYVAISER
jgi:hypothetical protein